MFKRSLKLVCYLVAYIMAEIRLRLPLKSKINRVSVIFLLAGIDWKDWFHPVEITWISIYEGKMFRINCIKHKQTVIHRLLCYECYGPMHYDYSYDITDRKYCFRIKFSFKIIHTRYRKQILVPFILQQVKRNQQFQKQTQTSTKLYNKHNIFSIDIV